MLRLIRKSAEYLTYLVVGRPPWTTLPRRWATRPHHNAEAGRSAQNHRTGADRSAEVPRCRPSGDRRGGADSPDGRRYRARRCRPGAYGPANSCSDTGQRNTHWPAEPSRVRCDRSSEMGLTGARGAVRFRSDDNGAANRPGLTHAVRRDDAGGHPVICRREWVGCGSVGELVADGPGQRRDVRSDLRTANCQRRFWPAVAAIATHRAAVDNASRET
jgi:hypothetical protein